MKKEKIKNQKLPCESENKEISFKTKLKLKEELFYKELQLLLSL